ncbi:MAG TPA: hypothetical protein VF585_05815, partial [Chthoniobacterales bacterium]
DYDPPCSFGLPDGHCYSLWYNGHGLLAGQIHKGWFPNSKKGWNYGCGEYGAEGLDPLDLMQRRYPSEWLPQPGEEESEWTAARISHAQSADMSHFFFDRPTTVAGWVEASQEHQRFATKLMTDAFRRDERMVSCAIHLFIDAWPAGWMKSIVDCERRPKPAFFALRDSLAPLFVSLRSDRFAVWAGENLETELWLCNDTPSAITDCKVQWQVEDASGKVLASGTTDAEIPSCAPRFQGKIRWQAPDVSSRGKVTLRAALVDQQGQVLSSSPLTLDVFPRSNAVPAVPVLLSEADTAAGKLVAEVGETKPQTVTAPTSSASVAVASHWPEDEKLAGQWLDWVAAGGKLILLDVPIGSYAFGEATMEVMRMGFAPSNFASRATGHPLVEGMEKQDFSYWYDPSVDHITPVLPYSFTGTGDWKAILVSGHSDWGVKRKPTFGAAELPHGAGQIIVCQARIVGRTSTNPSAALFVQRLLEPRTTTSAS